MAFSAFSDIGKYYSNISKDGRLRIWDTETNVLKQEYTPDLHLTSPPSCIQWITVSNSAKSPHKSGKRKQSFSEQEYQCIALGTTSGKILVYSVTQAKVENVLEDTSSRSGITTLDWHRKYGLYSCNRAGVVSEWDLQSGTIRNKYNVSGDKSKQGNGVSSIKLIPHNQKTPARYLVTSSWQVSVWRLHDREATVIRHLGHNTAPRALMMLVQLQNSCWLIQGSQNERLLSLWDITVTEDHIPQTNGTDITPSKRQRRKSLNATTSSPAYNFVLEDAPKFVDVNLTAEDGGNMLRLAAATRSGVVHYYGHMLSGASTKPIKPSVTIQVSTSEACPLPLHCCRLDNTELLLGYSSGSATLFERVTPDTSSKTQVLIRDDSRTPKKNKQTNEVNKVRSEAASGVTYVEPMGGVTRKRATPGGQVEVPMEARLENLSIDPRSRNKSAVNQNLTKLLMQGLHSKDKSLILTVLQKDDASVAARTAAALPADYLPLLLEQLADMATRKTSQCGAASTWALAALRAHAALLLAGAAAQPLAALLALFTYRRSHLCQLLNLKGRLELTMAQRNARDDAEDEQEAVIEYNDTSSDSELEIEQYQSESEQSWGDEGNADASASDLSDEGD